MTAASGGAQTTRPTRLPRSARRKQLLAAAQQIFVAHGYHAAAMDDIAERAGVSKPVLYQHFPGKLELYLALLDTHCDAIIAKVRGALEATPDNKERVKGAVRAYFDFMDHESEAFRLVFESDLRNDPQVRQRVERVEQGCIEALTETIISDTGLRPDQAKLLASGLAGASGAAAQYWLANGRPTPKAEAESLVAALIWRGIASFPLQGGSTAGTAPEIG
ncbi:TetR family transcriptional regulator [Actinoplanes ianthinogenes]|uniref:AcrR family transcriptional regulator n=2 Tax=Actinoplanes TaxID=1865 RepID=A0A7W7GUW4_9ACTN|nr:MULTISPECIES: TetR/AcrR family transcriptional regulator [Actinoplanes]MBB4738763.1 AcrR family transcriptional regulator [Actinoplanes octamycinicus]BCJ44213.1 TetR family transcriptional regulator [Actinoplanes ianthinogenes]GGQ96529.1 TetR family transcriptional regulator [Actinoplanes ianthinogenes]GIE61496.1 TetR family transcriptional regulator [Actinoplanes octamycinicus]